MKLFFTRSENDEAIVIRYTPTWFYLLMIGIALMLLVTFVRFPFNPEPLKQTIFWGYVGLFVFHYIATRKTRREIFQAIRERRITVSGSRFNPKNPLVVRITKLDVVTADAS